MTLLGVVGMLLGLLAWPYAMVERTRLRVAVFVLAYLAHIGTAIVYYFYSLANVTDATNYYYDYLNFAAQGFGIATQIIYFVVQTMKGIFGGTFLDYYLVFQVFGFWGICVLMRIFEELYADLNLTQPIYSYLMLFLPGLHFWTSAIGKDAPLFLGVCLGLWAAMNVRKRYWVFGIGMLLITLIRPHVGLLGIAAIAIALVFDRGTRLHIRILLVCSSLVGLAVAAASVQTTFGVDVTNADSVSDFFATRESITSDTSEAGNTGVYGNFAVRFLSLLFRPMFIDADGAFGYIASAENLVLLIVIGTIVIRWRDTLALAKSATFIRFGLALALTVSIVLTMVYYNVGLGLRQKTMFTPALIVTFIAVLAVRRVKATLAATRDATGRGLVAEPGLRRVPVPAAGWLRKGNRA